MSFGFPEYGYPDFVSFDFSIDEPGAFRSMLPDVLDCEQLRKDIKVCSALKRTYQSRCFIHQDENACNEADYYSLKMSTFKDQYDKKCRR